MPTCSSSVARARRSLREGAMTMQALDTQRTSQRRRSLSFVNRLARRADTRPEALRRPARQAARGLSAGRASIARRAPRKSEEASCGRARAKGEIWKRRSMPTSATARGTRPPSWKCSRSRGASTTCTRTCAASCGPSAGASRFPCASAARHVEYQPLGVVGIVAPWNYPMSLALMPLATALAAGNRAMIKPSELTPATSDALAALVAETFSEDEVTVVTGDASVGAAFAALPFDHLFFTGSTAVGRAVMRAASEHLVPVTLELGGKSPVLVDRGQPLERVAADIALRQAGQCRPDVHRAGLRAVARGRRRRVRRGMGQGGGGALPGGAGERGLHLDRERAPLRPPARAARRRAGEGRARRRNRTVTRAREGSRPHAPADAGLQRP